MPKILRFEKYKWFFFLVCQMLNTPMPMLQDKIIKVDNLETHLFFFSHLIGMNFTFFFSLATLFCLTSSKEKEK